MFPRRECMSIEVYVKESNFVKPNKVQLSIGAVKVIVVPGESLRRFGLSAGRTTNAVHLSLGDTSITA